MSDDETDLEKYTHKYWKSVIPCKECIHRPLFKGRYENLQPPIRNGEFDEKCPYVCADWYYTRMPHDDDFCSKGERKK